MGAWSAKISHRVNRVRGDTLLRAEQKLRTVLDGVGDHSLISELCERYEMSDSGLYEALKGNGAWRPR